MCGIFAIFSSSYSETELRRELIACSARLRHRGPDWSGYKVIEVDPTIGITHAHGIAHERLAIMDPESGSQPLVSHDGNVVCAANGEIYNYKELYESLEKPYAPKTGSDCEVILPLYEQYGPTIDFPKHLRGMFSFILYDRRQDLFVIVRDHMGITPLYIGWANDGSIYVGSEMKSLMDKCAKFQWFPPGHLYVNKGKQAGLFQRWYTPTWAPEMKPGVPLPKQKFQPVSTVVEGFVDYACTYLEYRDVENADGDVVHCICGIGPFALSVYNNTSSLLWFLLIVQKIAGSVAQCF
jgi:asparagine synthase (glutamine-hydrolysing)